MFGTAIGYPTAALPQLEVEEDPQLVLDEQTRSWFAPTFNICLVIFMIPGGILCNKIGRRGIMLFAIPFKFVQNCVLFLDHFQVLKKTNFGHFMFPARQYQSNMTKRPQ